MGSRKDVWEKLQVKEVKKYQDAFKRTGNYLGYFSINIRDDSRSVGNRIAEYCHTCLDIGSGILPLPVYMCNETRFFGIDPFFGEDARQFPFINGIGEYLPFANNQFDCISFMSSLDHQIEPLISLREAWRVMKPNGRLYLWLGLRSEHSPEYINWRSQPPGTLFNEHHQWAFIKSDILELLYKAGFTYRGQENYPGTTFYGPTQLITGDKHGNTL